MRRLLLILFAFACLRAHAQRVNWSAVDMNPAKLNPKLPQAHLGPAQLRSVRRMLLADTRQHGQEDPCLDDTSWLNGLSFFRAPLGRSNLLYISPGAGCMRGGQGSNAALWLVDLSSARPALLAGPRDGFDGWGLGIQPHTSHGLHDVVLGWHDSAFAYNLSYLRFTGKRYRAVATQLIQDCRMPPAESDGHLCLENGRRARDTERY